MTYIPLTQLRLGNIAYGTGDERERERERGMLQATCATLERQQVLRLMEHQELVGLMGDGGARDDGWRRCGWWVAEEASAARLEACPSP